MNATPGRNSIAQGALFTVAMRWSSRLVSIVSTLILARLLVPDDFGVVALAFMVLAFIQVFLEFGVNIPLIQNTTATEDHFQSAWTLRLMQTGAVAAVLAATAPWAADYFRDPRLTPVLWVLAVNVLIGSLENIGIVAFQKNMQFGLEFRYLVINRIATFVFVVAGALMMRSYWAMIIGGTLGGLFTVAHSYVAHPMRPRWNTSRLRELFSVSQWLLLRNIGLYADQNLHKVLVGRRTDTATMGGYSLASDVAGMPSSELLQPLNRVLFPAFAQAKNDLAELRRLFLLAQSVQVLVAVPAGTAMALMADEIVTLLFGEKWQLTVPFLRVLALAAVLEAISTSAGFVNLTLGRFREVTAVVWAQVALFVALALAISNEDSALRIAELRVAALFIGLVLQITFVLQALSGLTLAQMVAGVWRPLVTCGALWLLTAELEALVSADSLMLLLLKIALWATVYPAGVLALWSASGRPAGGERFLMDKFNGARQRFRARQRHNQ